MQCKDCHVQCLLCSIHAASPQDPFRAHRHEICGFMNAARNGHVHCFQHFLDVLTVAEVFDDADGNHNFVQEAARIAVSYRNEEVLLHLLQNDVYCNLLQSNSSGITFTARNKSNTRMLQLLQDYSFAFDEFSCVAASTIGAYDNLKWLHENGCPWDRWTVLQACLFGHKSCLFYAILNGCEHNLSYKKLCRWRQEAAIMIQKHWRAWIVRDKVYYNPHSEIGHRRLYCEALKFCIE